MSGNGHRGRAFRGRHDDFHYFDQLPPTARAALAGAVFRWSAGAVLTRWRRGQRGYVTGADIARTVAEADQRQIAKDRRRVWGIK